MMKSKARNRNRLKRGATLFEVVIASGISTVVMYSLVLTLLSGSGSWIKGQSKIDVDVSSQQSLRAITVELREAMAVSIVDDGKTVEYRLPKKENGEYKVPAEWDGVERKIKYIPNSKSVTKVADNDTTVLCTGVYPNDPKTGTAYKVFTAGAGAMTRDVTIMLVLSAGEGSASAEKSRIRETIYLRNVPSLTR